MAGTIEFIMGRMKTSKTEYAERFPGVVDMLVVHNTAMGQLCPWYMKKYLDTDKTAFYMLFKCDPLKGDCSREMMHELLDDFFYEKCRCPSSYDGDYSRSEAVSHEILPAKNDSEYKTYYEEQMELLKKMMGVDPETEAFVQKHGMTKEQFKDKYGFDYDDPSIIDVSDPADDAVPATTTSAVDQSAGTAVGMPKPIWYAVVFHADSYGNKLGYNGAIYTLDGQKMNVKQFLDMKGNNPMLSEKDMDNMMNEALDAALGKKKGRLDESAPFTRDDAEAIADMFSDYGAGRIIGHENPEFIQYLRIHNAELKNLANQASRADKLGDFSHAQNLDEGIGREAGMIAKYIEDAIRLAGRGEGVGQALCDVYERFFGSLPADLNESGWGGDDDFDDEDADEIAAITGNYTRDSGNLGGVDTAGRRSERGKLPTDSLSGQRAFNRNADAANKAVRSQNPEDFAVKECGDLDQIDDEEILSESLIRQCNRLSRELW